MRHTSTDASSDGWLVAGSMRRMFGGRSNVIRTRPFCRRLLKSLACLPVDPEVVGVDRTKQRIVGLRVEASPQLRATGTSRRRWRARAGSWSVGMWQSAHDRRWRPRPSRRRSKKAPKPRSTASHGSPPQSAAWCVVVSACGSRSAGETALLLAPIAAANVSARPAARTKDGVFKGSPLQCDDRGNWSRARKSTGASRERPHKEVNARNG